jgi:hypothetical protein
VPYRKSLNFTFDGLKSAATAIERLRNFKLRLETDKFPKVPTSAAAAHRRREQAFIDSLDDDLNTAEALAAVFEYVRDANSAMDAGEFRAGNRAAALEFLARFDSVFDVLKPTAQAGNCPMRKWSALIEARTAAKKAELRTRRPDPPAASGTGHHPGRHQVRRALEEEIAVKIHTKAVHAGDRKKAGAHVPHHDSHLHRLELLLRQHGAARPHLRPGRAGYCYARYDNPSNAALEELVAALEGGHGALACASGMAAIHMACSRRWPTGANRWWPPTPLYGATVSLLMNVLEPMGVACVSPMSAIWTHCARPWPRPSPAASDGDHFESAAARGPDRPHRRNRARRPARRWWWTTLSPRPCSAAARNGREFQRPQRHQVPGRPRRRAGRHRGHRRGALRGPARAFAHVSARCSVRSKAI